MKILLSNDDGFISPGLLILQKRLKEISNLTTVVPDRDRSGASNSLTLVSPLRKTQRGDNFYSVNGTPTDCVHLALTGLYEEEPDLVISGINMGANLGDDVIYSGTVAAAMEGRNLGLPAIAVSICSFQPNYLVTAVKAVEELLPNLHAFNDSAESNSDNSYQSATLLNINVPDIPWSEIKGFKSTRLGSRHKAKPVVKSQDPRGEEIFWVGSVGEQQDAGEGTDFHAVMNEFISITPIHIDLTRHQSIGITQKWLDELNNG